MQVRPGRRRRPPVPQPVEQFIDAHDAPGAQQQHAQQRPLLTPPHRHERAARSAHFKGAQQAKDRHRGPFPHQIGQKVRGPFDHIHGAFPKCPGKALPRPADEEQIVA
ncbi:hypothetical protein GCM10020218_080190 [Dactylosporangium vinaceum]